MAGRKNNRKESRETGSLEWTASSQDGGDKFIGLVANISMSGIALMNVPESIIIHQQPINIKRRNEDFQITMQVMWEVPQYASGKLLGGQLNTAPLNWPNLVQRLEHEAN